jgi:hypothetical protein
MGVLDNAVHVLASEFRRYCKYDFRDNINLKQGGNKYMSFAILRCNKCGKVFPYYHCSHKRTECTNLRVCNNKIWIDKTSMATIRFGTDFQPESNTAYIFVNVFNNFVSLAARVYSDDAKNFVIIQLNERSISDLTRKDTISALPDKIKHSSSWDGLIVESGCYPVSPEMEIILRRNLYVRGVTDV